MNTRSLLMQYVLVFLLLVSMFPVSFSIISSWRTLWSIRRWFRQTNKTPNELVINNNELLKQDLSRIKEIEILREESTTWKHQVVKTKLQLTKERTNWLKESDLLSKRLAALEARNVEQQNEFSSQIKRIEVQYEERLNNLTSQHLVEQSKDRHELSQSWDELQRTTVELKELQKKIEDQEHTYEVKIAELQKRTGTYRKVGFPFAVLSHSKLLTINCIIVSCR